MAHPWTGDLDHYRCPGPGDRRLIMPLRVDASGTIAVRPRADLRGGAVPAPPPMITGVLPASIMWHTCRDEPSSHDRTGRPSPGLRC
jgi:hypothetical protein